MNEAPRTGPAEDGTPERGAEPGQAAEPSTAAEPSITEPRRDAELSTAAEHRHDAAPSKPAEPSQAAEPAVAAGPPAGGGAKPASGVLTVIAVLLTVGAAATDVASFTRLGSVFASVMTSNIVFLGLAAARQSATLAWHAAVSFAGYVVGVAAGSRLARTGGRRAGRDEMPWSRWIAATLIAESAVFVVFTVGWEVTGASPAGAAQLFLIAVATVAMGMQSAVVTVMGIAGVSTTYLTGTLTSLIDAIAGPGPAKGANTRRFVVLLALVAGAGLSGLLIATAPSAVPAVPLAMVLGSLGVGSGLLHRPHRRA